LNKSPHDIEESDPFVLQANPEMCHYCFAVLLHHFNSTADPPSPDFSVDESSSSPLFVTWEKRKGHRYILRGCIGTLSPRLLKVAIGDYALTAALRDRRFNPIQPAELSELRVGVSLLVNYETCENVYDWEVGVHGIIITFIDAIETSEYTATFLPEVAQEQG